VLDQCCARLCEQQPRWGKTPAPVLYHKNLPYGPEGLTWDDLQRRDAALAAGKAPTGDTGEGEPTAGPLAWATEARRNIIFDRLRRDAREFTSANDSYAPWTTELLLRVMPALRHAGVTHGDLVLQLLRWGCVRTSGGGWVAPSS
jgi:hypothetical protein